MAATDLERLVVQLSADIKKYENAMRRAQGITNQQLGNIQRKADSVSKGIGLSFARSGAAIIAGIAASEVVREMVQLSEAATRVDNSLKVAGLSGADLERVYQALSASAKANGAPIETLAALYGKAAQAQKELGVTSAELLGFTNNVALALRVAGTDAQTASGALLQLGQALGSGKVQAEEFNSILEGAPTIAQAAAAGLREAGGSVSQLKKLVVEGKISSEAFFRAFEAGAPILEQKAANSVFTIAQATTNLRTALIDVAREFNNSTGASESFAGGINTAANAISSFDVSGFIDRIREMRGELDGFLADLGNAEIFKRLNELTGVTKDGLVVNVDKTEADTKVAALENEVKDLQERIALNTSLGFDNSEALARLNEVRGTLAALRAEAAGMAATVDAVNANGDATTTGTNGMMGGSTSRGGARKPVAVNPVSIADFKAPPGASGGGGARKRGKSGGESDYQREIEQIKERTAALQAETAAQATVNPLIDDYGFASERARVAQELLTAAQKSGLAAGKELKDVAQFLSGNFDGLSPKAREQAQAMLDLANGYANASVEAERLKQSQDKVKQAADDFKSTAKSVVGGFISDLRQGKSAAEALSNALDKVVDKLIDMALNAAFDGFGGAGGLFGSLFGGGASQFAIASGGGIGLYKDGGYTGNGGKYQPAGIVHKGEYVMDAEATKRIGVDNLRKLQGYASGGYVGSAPRLPRMPGSSVGGVVVNITNNSQAQISQQSRKTASGTKLDVIVDEMAADKMSTPGSRLRGSVQQQFGLKSGLARR